MSDDNVTTGERAVLDALSSGPLMSGTIMREVGFAGGSVTDRLDRLVDAGLVRAPTLGDMLPLYRLTDAGRAVRADR